MIQPGKVLRDATVLLVGGTLVAALVGGFSASLGFAAAGAITVANLFTIRILVQKLLSERRAPWVMPALIGKTVVIAAVASWLLTLFPLVAVLSGFGVGLIAITLRGVQGLFSPALIEGEA